MIVYGLDVDEGYSMKKAVCIMVLAAAVSLLAACSKTTVTVTDKIVQETQVTVREVRYVNDEYKRAVTRVLVSEDNGLTSMVHYDFPGYKIEIAVGMPATKYYLFVEETQKGPGGTLLQTRYAERLCVKTVQPEPVCTQMESGQ